MKWRIFFVGLLLLVPLFLAGQTVMTLKVDDAITPAIASYIHRGITEAEKQKADAVVIELNTPGGLLTATREIVGAIQNSSVPVIVYVYPGGSRAASAGVFITLSANIAAMAPATNIGAAHPVVLNGTMDSIESRKATNDARAFMRSIAQKRNRNIEVAQEAVENSISLTETEALRENLIDLIADNPGDLLQKINGDTVKVTTGITVLHTAGARMVPVEMTFSEKLTVLLSNPNLMYILLLLGMFGVLFEFFNPGGVLPGVVGVIALILAFYSMSILPINYAGLALVILAMILFILDVKMTSHGILTIGGIVALFLGSVMLLQTHYGTHFLKISLSIIISAVIVTTAFFLFIIGLGLNAQKNRITSGREAFIGRSGTALEMLAPFGRVRVYGEIWKAESVSGPIEKGQKVQVTGIDNLKIYVKAFQEE